MFKRGAIPAEARDWAQAPRSAPGAEDGVRMKWIRKLTVSRMSRLGWGIALLALAAVLALTFVFAWSAVAQEQRAAQARAVGFTTKKPLSALSSSEVSKPIHAGEYTQLINDSKARILSDDRVTRVRIWNLGGTLVFSTDTVDKISVAQTASAPFKAAASGSVASVSTDPRVSAGGGLDGSSERLFVTFAALRLNNQARPAAVVEVDQRYEAIRAAAYRLWRPVQLVIVILLLLSLLMLAVSFLAMRGPVRPSTPVNTTDPGFTPPTSSRVVKELESRLRDLEDSLRGAEARVASTEREKRQIAERLVSAHEQLELMTAAAKSGARSEGNDAATANRLSALELERDRLADELERLRASVDEQASARREADPDAAVVADEDPTARIEELEAALVDATAKAHSMESAAKQMVEERKQAASELEQLKQSMVMQESEMRPLEEELEARREDVGANDSILAVEAATKLADVEEQLRQSSERSMHAENRAAQAEDELKRLQKELGSAERRANESSAAAQKAEAGAAEAEERVREAEDRVRQAEEAMRRAHEEVTKAEQRANAAGADAQRSEERRVRLQARLDQLEGGDKEVERRAHEAEQRLAQLQAVTGQAEERMTQLEATTRQAEQRMAQEEVRLREVEGERARLATELERVLAAGDAGTGGATGGDGVGEGRMGQLAARIEELETKRRKDVSELQRVRKALANTQLELTAATERAKDAESRLMRPEGSAAPRAATAEEVARAPDHDADIMAARLTKIRRKNGETDAAAEQEAEEPEQAAEFSKEGLSLRERLARAAAARHRSTEGLDDGGSS
jgi:hypothetical protein